MGCGCNKKKRTAKSANTPNVEYSANGTNDHVRLGLKPFFALPIRLPQAINGKDVIIVASSRKAPAKEQGALIIVGRNAKIEKAHRQEMTDKWPQAFIDV